MMFKIQELIKKQLITISFICFIQLSIAQNFTHEFGKYSNEEFQMQQYAKDPSAEAVIIYDIGKSFFILSDNGFELFFERRTKIRILTKAGLKWAQIAIPYYEEKDKSEKIYELIGNTYNMENGTIRKTELDPKNTYNEKFNEHWSNKKFAMPDVKEGSVIEVAYKIRSPYLFNLRNWQFQNKIPVIYSEYTTMMIPFYEYIYILQGAKQFDNYKTYVDNGLTNRLGSIEYHDMVYYFVMKDLPAFKDETFIPSLDDYLVKLDFQLSVVHTSTGGTIKIMTTWKELSEEMIENSSFGKYLKNSQKNGKEFIDTMQLSLKSSIEKVKIIDRFVKSNFNWNGYNDKFASKKVNDFLTSKTGNCADINLFLAGMLNSAGIEAYPAILSTRDHGKIKSDYPFQHFFNYVVVVAKIDSSSILLDATEPLSNFNEIPSRCLNDKGLIIQKKNVEWIDFKTNSISSIEYNFDLKLNPDKDSIYEYYRLITTGYEAIDYRNKFLSNYKELKAELQNQNTMLTDTLRTTNLYQIERPFEMSFNNKIQTETVEDKIIISPFCNKAITENPLKLPFRNYPVDMVYRNANIFNSTIDIPKGYKILTKPDNINLNNNLVKIIYAIDILNSSTLKVSGTYEFKKDLYGVSEYFDLKGYFNMIVTKFNEKIVFVKE